MTDTTSSPAYEVRDSGIEGRGLFATASIQPGARIIEYTGERISKAESLKRCQAGNNYIFHLTEQVDLDGSIEANIARFINHSCAPNAEAEIDDDDRIWIIALREIRPGEEITFNYGYDLEDFREHPCRCGAERCIGYILSEEYWGSVARCGALESVNGTKQTAL